MTLLTFGSFLFLKPNIAQAQIIPDNTLGNESSIVNQLETLKQQIEGGAIRGENLFHSFLEFNVGNGESVYFVNPNGVNNILTRVTGNNISQILGTLGINGNANLYFLNPNGILFGPNAALDLNGSFLGTTANSILFNNYEFSATQPEAPPLLTINMPIGLRFNNNPTTIKITTGQKYAPIIINENGDTSLDNIQLLNEKTSLLPNSISGKIIEKNELDVYQLYLLSGTKITPTTADNVKNQLFLLDSQGNIISNGENSLPEFTATENGTYYLAIKNLTETGGNYIVNLTEIPENPHTLKVNPNQNLALISSNIAIDGGKIISPESDINIRGLDVNIINGSELNVRSEGGGNININAQNFNLNGDSKIRAGIAADLGSPNAKGGDININAQENITISDISFIANTVNAITSQGNAGNININANSLFVNDNSSLNTSTYGKGNAGNININTQENVILKGDLTTGAYPTIATIVNSGAEGKGGNLNIQTSNFTADDALLGTSTLGTGNAGNININADNINLKNKSSFLANTIGIGDSGLIKLNATNGINLSGGSSIYSEVEEGAIGNSNGIEIDTKTLNLSEQSYLFSRTFSEGNGGNITINSNTISLDNLSLIGSSGISGSSGNSASININTDSIDLKNGSQIDAGNYGSGNANNVTIKANNQANFSGIYNDGKDIYGSAIITSATTGNAGNIDVMAGSISLRDQAQITSNTNGKGTGGNINLTATNGDISLTNGAEIQTVTRGSGNAGNLSLQTTTGKILLDSSTVFSTVEAGATGNGGNIDVKAQSLRLENGGQIQTTVKNADTEQNLPAGKGIAGNINIDVTDSVSLSGTNSSGKNSGIFSILGQGEGQAGDIKIKTKDLEVNNGVISSGTIGTGNAGTITLNVDSFNLSNNGILINSTAGQGKAGDINITATGDLSIDNSNIFSRVESKGVSNSTSNINITANNLQLTNGGTIIANSEGIGNSGNITIDAISSISVDGKNNNGKSRISNLIDTNGIGNAGNIELNTNNLSLNNGGAIAADTRGKGNSGNIKITAENITLNNRSFIDNAVFGGIGNGGIIEVNSNSLLMDGFSGITSFLSGGQGNAGIININSKLIKLTNAGSITASAGGTIDDGGNITKIAVGNAGNININSQDLIIEGVDSQGRFSNISTVINSGAQGDSGNITINTARLRINDGGSLSNSIGKNAKGNGGNININVTDSFKIDGFSDLSGTTSMLDSFTQGEGKAGNININANLLELTNGGLIAASTSNTATGKGGNIDITANNLTINNAFGINTSTDGNFDAGNINLKVLDNLTISGKIPSGTYAGNFSSIAANTSGNSTGNGGSIFIDSNNVTIKDGASISVSSAGKGEGGNIALFANTLNLDLGFITAATNSTDGGSVDLNVQNILNLRNRSEITATAGKTQGAGDGGNIIINAPFIISYPSNPVNNIIANAYAGNGGNINITTNSIFGSEYLTIEASSQLGLDGEVIINNLEVDPTSGLIEIAANFIDAESLVAKNPCEFKNNKIAGGSSFIIKGKGGIPSTPEESRNDSNWLLQWATPETNEKESKIEKSVVIVREREEKDEIVWQQAQGWLVNREGKIVLTSKPTTEITSQTPYLIHPSCTNPNQ